MSEGLFRTTLEALQHLNSHINVMSCAPEEVVLAEILRPSRLQTRIHKRIRQSHALLFRFFIL